MVARTILCFSQQRPLRDGPNPGQTQLRAGSRGAKSIKGIVSRVKSGQGQIPEREVTKKKSAGQMKWKVRS